MFSIGMEDIGDISKIICFSSFEVENLNFVLVFVHFGGHEELQKINENWASVFGAFF